MAGVGGEGCEGTVYSAAAGGGVWADSGDGGLRDGRFVGRWFLGRDPCCGATRQLLFLTITVLV